METTDNERESVPPPLTAPATPCFVCKQPASQRCSNCGNARYCSGRCQKKGWKMHKMLCSSFASLEPRPGPNFFRGILFPATELLPRFVWVEYGDSADFTTIESEPFMGKAFLSHVFHDGWRLLKRPIGYRLGIWYQDNYMNDGSPMTPTLTRWLGPVLGHYFRGPFLAHGYENGEKYSDGDESEDGKPCDLDTSALAILLDFFQAQSELYYTRKISG